MPVLTLWGYKKKGAFPHQIPGYSISATDRMINEKYTIRRMELEPDYAGEVIATLLRHDARATVRKAVLYLHGYGDYFFHDHVCSWYNDRGYNFYALDLRKHGRSLLPHQKACYVKNLEEYFEEISEAVQIIKEVDGNDTLLLQAHSTGGLIGALYADKGPAKSAFDALILNSPFFAFKTRSAEKKVMNLVGAMSRWRPGVRLPVEFEGFYGQSLHKDYLGEWDYTQVWKPVKGHPLYGAWLRAVKKGHQQVYQGLSIEQPTLVMRSNNTFTATEMSDAVFVGDVVLNVADMTRYSAQLGKQVDIVTVENAVHDIFLSREPVRAKAFESLEEWLEKL